MTVLKEVYKDDQLIDQWPLLGMDEKLLSYRRVAGESGEHRVAKERG